MNKPNTTGAWWCMIIFLLLALASITNVTEHFLIFPDYRAWCTVLGIIYILIAVLCYALTQSKTNNNEQTRQDTVRRYRR